MLGTRWAWHHAPSLTPSPSHEPLLRAHCPFLQHQEQYLSHGQQGQREILWEGAELGG